MKVLFVCGSLNQTKMMHQISQHLPHFDKYFTPYFCDGLGKLVQRSGALDFTVLGGRFLQKTMRYLTEQGVALDIEGRARRYDLVVTCSDLIVPYRIRGTKLVLVQEGMTDPENFAYHVVRTLRLPRWVAQTSTTGLSDLYDIFCVASDGYRDLFISKGIRPEKLRVTGIPNFDHCDAFRDNDFPHRDYVLVATSDMRETFKYENRPKFIDKAKRLAEGRPMIFKFHPNENPERAGREVERHAPDALYFADGNTDHMLANCEALVTRYSSVVYVAAALGKEIHCDLATDLLRRLQPWQKGGTSAQNIARECLKLFEPGYVRHHPRVALPMRRRIFRLPARAALKKGSRG